MESMATRLSSKKSKIMRLPKCSRTPSKCHPRQEQTTATHAKNHGASDLSIGHLGNRSCLSFEATEAITQAGPPPYGSDATSTLALPVNRLSDSSRSDVSSGEHGVYGTTTTTTHTVQTTTTFFRLPRRRKPTPFFDLSHLPQNSTKTQPSQAAAVSRTPARSPRTSLTESVPLDRLQSHSIENLANQSRNATPPSPTPPKSSCTNFEFDRHESRASFRSSATRSKLGLRARSSTSDSTQGNLGDDQALPPAIQSRRTSSSAGRKSFGEFFGLTHKMYSNSELPFPRHGSAFATGSKTSKNNSMQLARELPIVLPERYEDEPPAKYLIRLEEAVSRGVVASVLSKGSDPFSKAVLRSYMRGFGFFGDPMDMAIRKLLMEVELPKETQQIDRCLQGFANRYHECNPGIYASPDQAYFIAFSLLILHTDVFNKNNKHKMQKSDYLKNTRGEGIFDEVLECFYDNISYTPFIHVEDDIDINGERIIPHKLKKRHMFSGTGVPVKRPSKEPVDPYTLLIDSKLDTLRPNLKDVMYLEEHYSYLGTASSLNLSDLQNTFFRTGVLQIVSARSRPDAFMSDRTVRNPEEAQAGIVDIKITKVGLLWRKDQKKKKTRSPWQEWGAILTGAQLYFFRNTAWIKSLMHQLDVHIKQGHDGTPVIFKPPLDQFKPDAFISTDNSVALLDIKYKKHKNAFVFVRHAGLEETFLADNEDEMNDWLAKLNYAAAFRTSGVRMRGVVGGVYDSQRSRGIRRMESHVDSNKSAQISTAEINVSSSRIDAKMAQDILSARKEIMLQKIADAEEKLSVAQKHLDLQLRNARHLQILAPIQPKTRENVLMAAGKIAAQLKWRRMRIWSLKCHKDILTMDLEEEKKISSNTGTDKTDLNGMPIKDPTALHRSHSKASTALPLQSPRSVTSTSTATATADQSPTPPKASPDAVEYEEYEEAQAASISARPLLYHRSQVSRDIPSLDPEAHSHRSPSPSSLTVPTSPKLDSTPSKISSKSLSKDIQRELSDDVDAVDQSTLEEYGLFFDHEKTLDLDCPVIHHDSEDSLEKAPGRDKQDHGKIRRSFHRTLRETSISSHNRSRRSKDFSSGSLVSDQNKDDVLFRGNGSFVVHGKKASVITLSSELQGLSSDDRLRIRRQSYNDCDVSSPISIDDDFHSAFAEPFDLQSDLQEKRHNSEATISTVTSKSFRDLRRKIVAHASDSDCGDSEVGASISDVRPTTLTPTNDNNSIHESSYTSQKTRTPTKNPPWKEDIINETESILTGNAHSP